jgi:very-short-patch-repair endonuclease
VARKEFVKITEEMLDGHLNMEDVSGVLSDSVNKIIEETLHELRLDLNFAIKDCESPIEQIMALKMYKFLNSWSARRIEFEDKLDIIGVINQNPIRAEGNDYRVDFMVGIWDTVAQQGTNFVIECDGHDFHEKTKEQAQRDKQRDRDLATAGFVVMHFTGSEVFNDNNIASDLFQKIRTIVLKKRSGR